MTVALGLLGRIAPPAMPWAACRFVAHPAIFLSVEEAEVGEAKAVCEGCHHRLECLEHSLFNREQAGTWGGVSEKERDELFRRDRKARRRRSVMMRARRGV